MSKLLSAAVVASLALVAPSVAQARTLGPDAAACEAGGSSAVLVRVDGFKQRTGKVRVQIYGSNPDHFLAKGKWVKRIDLPVTQGGRMDVCVALPAAGNYAVAVRHDVDGNGKSGWNDGGGFSRNPSLSLTSLKPKYSEVFIPVAAAPRTIDVTLNYRRGLSIGPARSAR
jgi:uncharacterized protein (DUF2141 family)